MPRGNKILIRTGSSAPSAGDFVTSEPAWDSSAGKLYIKGSAGMVEIGAAGSIASYATTASFPGTGNSQTVYLSQASGRLYRWVSADGVYAECGTIGGLSALDGGTYA